MLMIVYISGLFCVVIGNLVVLMLGLWCIGDGYQEHDQTYLWLGLDAIFVSVLIACFLGMTFFHWWGWGLPQ